MSIQQDVIGFLIKGTVKENGVIVNVSSASIKKFYLSTPAGVLKTVDAAFFTDGTDGILKYVTVAEDLDESGVWTIQGYVELSSGFKGRTSVKQFAVNKNLVAAQ